MKITPEWRVREPPLAAAAVVAGPDSHEGLRRATVRRLATGAWLRACAADGWLLVLGGLGDLPWAANVTFLGWDAGVLLPTTASVHPPAAILRSATGAAVSDLVVLLPGTILTAPMPQRRADPGLLG